MTSTETRSTGETRSSGDTTSSGETRSSGRTRAVAAVAGLSVVGALVPLSGGLGVAEAAAQELVDEANVVAELTAAREGLVAAKAQLVEVQTSRVSLTESLETAEAAVEVAEEAVRVSTETVAVEKQAVEAAAASLAVSQDALDAAQATADLASKSLESIRDQVAVGEADIAAAEALVVQLEAAPPVSDAQAALAVTTKANQQSSSDSAVAAEALDLANAALADADAVVDSAPDAAALDAAAAAIGPLAYDDEAAQEAYEAAVAAGSPDADALLIEFEAASAALDESREYFVTLRTAALNLDAAIVAQANARTAQVEAAQAAEVAALEAAAAAEALDAATAVLAEAEQLESARVALAEAQDVASGAVAALPAAQTAASEAEQQLAEARSANAVAVETLDAAEVRVSSLNLEVDAATSAAKTAQAEMASLKAEATALASEEEAVTERIRLLEQVIADLELVVETPAVETSGTIAVDRTDSLEALTPIYPDKSISAVVVAGALPDGLTLNVDGTFDGTPTKVGSWQADILVTDIETGDQELRTTVFNVEPKTLDAIAVTVVGTRGEAVVALAPITDGNAISVSLLDGELPAGVTLNADGTLVGEPELAGVWEAEVLVIDEATEDQQVRTLSFEIAEQTEVEFEQAVALELGEKPDDLEEIAPGNGIEAVIVDGDLPSGITMALDGSFEGGADSVSSVTVEIMVTDTETFDRELRAMAITVLEAPTETSVARQETVGTTADVIAPIVGGQPIEVEIVSGDLPAGLTVSASGFLAGTPTTSGTWEVEFLVTDVVTGERELRTVAFRVDALRTFQAPRGPEIAATPTPTPEPTSTVNLGEIPDTLAFVGEAEPDVLAFTGAETWVFAVSGLGTVIAGAATLVASRRVRLNRREDDAAEITF